MRLAIIGTGNVGGVLAVRRTPRLNMERGWPWQSAWRLERN